MTCKALFLDRDGVINHDDSGYTYRIEDFRFVDGIFELARTAIDAGYKLAVVTNQAGIGRGYYSEAQFGILTTWMKEQFAREGAPISAVYYCPHHPVHAIGKYLQDCDCRKPRPGLLLRAQRELDIDMADSLLVGDKPSDIEAGRRAGVGCTILMADEAYLSPLDPPPTYVTHSHAELTCWLRANGPQTTTTARS